MTYDKEDRLESVLWILTRKETRTYLNLNARMGSKQIGWKDWIEFRTPPKQGVGIIVIVVIVGMVGISLLTDQITKLTFSFDFPGI